MDRELIEGEIYFTDNREENQAKFSLSMQVSLTDYLFQPTLFLFFNAPLGEECATSGLQVQEGGSVDDAHLIA